MAAQGIGRGQAAQRAERGQVGAPTWLRAALITATSTGLVLAIGDREGYWLCLPGLLLAAALAASAVGSVLCALPVLVGALLAGRYGAGGLPALWAALLVPVLSAVVIRGVSERLRGERDAMAQAALSDPLTGLANRRVLISRAGYELARHRRAGGRFVVVMLDLDGFKALNDRYGHAAGDAMLCDVADSLRATLRDQDTIARLGGDEFCVIAPETENAQALGEKIVGAVRRAAGGDRTLSTSLGLSIFPQDGTSIERLLRVADDRLLLAKRRHHSRLRRHAA